jgi:hypothetical protein
MGRKIPVFKVYIQPGASYEQLHSIPSIKEAVIGEVINAVKEAVKYKKSNIELFDVANSDFYIQLNKDKFKSSIETALEYFIEKEEYDKCIECRDLIKML